MRHNGHELSQVLAIPKRRGRDGRCWPIHCRKNLTPEARQRVVALALAGKNRLEIAAITRLHDDQIYKACHQAGVKLAKPEATDFWQPTAAEVDIATQQIRLDAWLQNVADNLYRSLERIARRIKRRMEIA